MALITQNEGLAKKRRDHTLMQMAYSELRESIITNQIKPGDVLSEQQIAITLNISRTPVREALAILENEGLVEIRRGIGAFVKPLSYDDILNIFEVRRSLEALAMKSAIHYITAQDIQNMRERFTAILAQCENNEPLDAAEFASLDADFHGMIIDRSKNPYVQRFMRSINSNVQRIQIMVRIINDPKDAVLQHLRLLDLMEQRKLDAILIELDHHLDFALQSVAK